MVLGGDARRIVGHARLHETAGVAASAGADSTGVDERVRYREDTLGLKSRTAGELFYIIVMCPHTFSKGRSARGPTVARLSLALRR